MDIETVKDKIERNSDESSRGDVVVISPLSEEHVNPDGLTDAQKGAQFGGVGGAVTGALAGSLVGVGGAAIGAVIGGVVGAVTSGLTVAQVDKFDGDSKNNNETIVLADD